MASVAIPLLTLQPGVRSFGPAATSSTDRQATLTLDRTVGASPLNAASPSTVLEFLVEFSVDGGATYPFSIFSQVPGGTYSDSETGQQNSAIISGAIPPGVTHVRGSITLRGSPVSVSGSLVTN